MVYTVPEPFLTEKKHCPLHLSYLAFNLPLCLYPRENNLFILKTKENNFCGICYLSEGQKAWWRFPIYSVIFAISLLLQCTA